ncbi:Rha family transcriptional regulator [Pseudomonas sp. C2L12B]|uniref:Rha family transcriptional regulator n=2 Tax=Pseudomonas typographi TaxID=2715964 RepID=A0ABR7ZA00_9PSED|nr:Rha family transcriptional regulator [Pseudomonas typographi]MBD1602380.1 Rha family transcriptional regulator [Pseudomonas typographi]
MEDFERTLHREVKAGGGTALAKRMGVNETTLLDCANPNRASHKMNIQMFGMVLTHLSEESRQIVLASLLAEFGYALISRNSPAARELSASMANFGKEAAELTVSVHEALEDNHVNQIERAAICREIHHVRRELDAMEASVKVA